MVDGVSRFISFLFSPSKKVDVLFLIEETDLAAAGHKRRRRNYSIQEEEGKKNINTLEYTFLLVFSTLLVCFPSSSFHSSYKRV